MFLERGLALVDRVARGVEVAEPCERVGPHRDPVEDGLSVLELRIAHRRQFGERRVVVTRGQRNPSSTGRTRPAVDSAEVELVERIDGRACRRELAHKAQRDVAHRVDEDAIARHAVALDQLVGGIEQFDAAFEVGRPLLRRGVVGEYGHQHYVRLGVAREVGGAHVLRLDSIELAVRLVTPRVHHVAARSSTGSSTRSSVAIISVAGPRISFGVALIARCCTYPTRKHRARLRLDAIQYGEHPLLCERRQFVGTVGGPQICPRPTRRFDTAVDTEVERLVDRRPRQLTGPVEGARFACGVGRPEEHRRSVRARGDDRVGHRIPPHQGALVIGNRGFVCVGLVCLLPRGYQPGERERGLLRGVPVTGEFRNAVEAGGGLGMLFERLPRLRSGTRPARRAAVRRGLLGAGARA